jgi:hypothetical protein
MTYMDTYEVPEIDQGTPYEELPHLHKEREELQERIENVLNQKDHYDTNQLASELARFTIPLAETTKRYLKLFDDYHKSLVEQYPEADITFYDLLGPITDADIESYAGNKFRDPEFSDLELDKEYDVYWQPYMIKCWPWTRIKWVGKAKTLKELDVFITKHYCGHIGTIDIHEDAVLLTVEGFS